MHFHRCVVFTSAHGLQTVHRVLPNLVSQSVCLVELAFATAQGDKDIGNRTAGAEPPFNVATATVVIDTDVPAIIILAHGDVDGLAGTCIKWHFTETNLRLHRIERLANGVAGLELLAERTVVSDVEHQRRIVLLENILEVTFHRRESETSHRALSTD